MTGIQATSLSSSAYQSSLDAAKPQQAVPQAVLPSIVIEGSIHISAESQYLFEMDKYLIGLDAVDRDRALEYLAQSEDPLQNKAGDYFRQNQEKINQMLGGKPLVLSGQLPPEKAERLLDTGFVLNEFTEIALRPFGVNVFRLDGQSNFVPVQFGGSNQALRDEVEALEAKVVGVIGNQDRANLFGSVENALAYSEHIMLSFDDVLHFNYAVEKAHRAIDFINAPEEMKARLTDILHQGIQYQNQKQTKALNDSKKFLGNSLVGDIANENIRLGTAAQRYNGQLQNALVKSNLSILDARGLIDQLLMDNRDLIRFNLDKLNDAIIYYKNDYEKFERALNKDISTPSELKSPELDRGILVFGSEYALKVIQSIQSHASKE